MATNFNASMTESGSAADTPTVAAYGATASIQENGDPFWVLPGGGVTFYMPGDDLLDHGPNAYTVTVNGTVTTSTAQHIGTGSTKSIDFTAANVANYLTAAAAAMPQQAKSYTLEAHIYRTATPGSSTNPEIISNFATATGRGTELYMGATSGVAASRVSKDGTSTAANPFAGNPGNNAWHHLCAVYDGTNIGVAVDGTWGASVSLTGATANVPTSLMNIGRQPDNAWPLQGYVAHIRVTYSTNVVEAARYAIGTNFEPPFPPYPIGGPVSVESSAAVLSYNSTTPETGTAADASSAAPVGNSTVIETGTAADTSDGSASVTSAISESAAAADAPSSSVATSAAISELASAVDAPTTTSDTAAAVTESGSASDAPSAFTGYLPETDETGAAADTSSASAAFNQDRAESGTAVDTSSAGGASASTAEVMTATDLTNGGTGSPTTVIENLTAADSPSSTAPLLERVVSESAPITDLSSVPPFVPGVADVEEVMDGQDTNTVSIMQAASVVEEIGMLVDSNVSEGITGFGASRVETLAAVDSSNGSVVVFFFAAQTEAGSAADSTSSGSIGYTAIVDDSAFGLIEITAGTVAFTGNLPEVLTLIDQATKTFSVAAVVAESGTAVDVTSLTGSTGGLAAVHETDAITDLATVTVNLGTHVIAEILHAVDASNSVHATAASVHETLAAMDTSDRLRVLNLLVSDALALVDVLTFPVIIKQASVSEEAFIVDHESARAIWAAIQAEVANAVDHPSAVQTTNLPAGVLEAAHATDYPNAIVPYEAAAADQVQAQDIGEAIQINGFILGNRDTVLVEYRRRVWFVTHQQRQD